MNLPTYHVCRAAIQVIDMVDQDGETAETLHAAYISYPGDGKYGVAEFSRGKEVLERARVVTNEKGRLYISDEGRGIARLPEDDAVLMLVEKLLLTERPPWVVAAAGPGVRWEYLPDSTHERMTQICPDQHRREEFLMAVARKVDVEGLRDVGSDGEEFVEQICREYLTRHGRPDLAVRVARVSEVSDQLGYDVVAPDLSGQSVRLEVKTQSGERNPARVLLSRNEARQGSRDDRWALIVCDRLADGTVRDRGWCRYDVIANGLPRDAKRVPLGRWKSVELMLDRGLLMGGLPLGRGALHD